MLLWSATAFGQETRSAYFNEPDAAHDPDLQEAKVDGGSHVYDGMLADLVPASSGWLGISNWDNPVDYLSLDVSGFTWDGPLMEGAEIGKSCYGDRYSTSSDIRKTVEYKWRRYSLNGATGVFFFPKDFTAPALCDSASLSSRKVRLFLENQPTSGDIHTDAYLGDQTDFLNPCASFNGPRPSPFGLVALDQDLFPYDPGNEPFHVVVRMSGGPGPHSGMLRMQHTLEARRAVETIVANDPDFCFELDRVLLYGGSFGSAIALGLQLIYPDLFHGAVATGASAVCTQAFFGYERILRYGLNTATSRGEGSAIPIWLSDSWIYTEILGVLSAHAANQMPLGSGALNNIAFLERVQERFTSEDDQHPLICRPFFIVDGDSDMVSQLTHFRFELEQIADRNVLGESFTYRDFLKIFSVQFRCHGDPAFVGSTFVLHPDKFIDDTAVKTNLVQLLIDLSYRSDTDLVQWTPPFDENVEEPNELAEFRSAGMTLVSPPNVEDAQGLDLDPLWASPSGEADRPGFVGTGDQPGMMDNTLAMNLDGDPALEVMYGENSGFVHLYEWDGSKLVSQWRSPDMGMAVASLSAGTFTVPGGGSTETGVVAITGSGELWMIRTAVSPPVATPITSAHFVYGGEREYPVVCVGPIDGEGKAAVYIVGTSALPKGQGYPPPPSDRTPNLSYISRLDFASLTDTTPQLIGQERCDTLMALRWDAAAQELLGCSPRGHLFRLKDLSPQGGPLDVELNASVGNLGLGHYLRMVPRDYEKVELSSGTVYLIAGQPGDKRGDPSPAEPLRNLVAIDTSGNLLDHFNVPRGDGSPRTEKLDGLELIAVEGDKARFAVAGDSGVLMCDFDFAKLPGMRFSQVQDDSSAAQFWGPRVELESGTGTEQFITTDIRSLQYFEETVGQETAGRLLGTGGKSLVWVWDVEPDFSAPPRLPVLLHQLDAFGGIPDLKAYKQAFDEFPPYDSGATPPFDCPADADVTLNVASFGSYDPQYVTDLADPNMSGQVYGKLDGRTGQVLCKRNMLEAAPVFNRERRTPNVLTLADALAYDVMFHQDEPERDRHVFMETMDVGPMSDLSFLDIAYTPAEDGPMNGKIRFDADYIANGGNPTELPSGTEFMVDDRYYVVQELFNPVNIGSAAQWFGNAIRSGHVLEGDLYQVVMTTIGGRVIFIAQGTPTTSWPAGKPHSMTGDYGYMLSGLALYDVDRDGFDEVFAVAMTSPGTASGTDNNSELLVWDSNGTGFDPANPTYRIDLGAPGAMGLWAGPALGVCDCENEFDLIIGQAQTFTVYDVTMNLNITPSVYRYRSEGLGANIGAMNTIEVLRGVEEPGPLSSVRDFVYIGTTGYVHAFETPTYSIGMPGHMHN